MKIQNIHQINTKNKGGCNILRADEIYRKTHSLIKKSGTNDPFIIASDNNIMIRSSTDFRELKGLYTIIKRKRIIIINENLSDENKKLICAHEIGHDMLHREFAKNKIMHDYALCCMSAKTECEANMFAADLLISDDEISELVYDGYDINQISKIICCDLNLVGIKLYGMNLRGYDFHLDTITTKNFLTS